MSEEKTARAIKLPGVRALVAAAALLLAFGLMAWSPQPAFADGDDQPLATAQEVDGNSVTDGKAGGATDPADNKGDDPVVEGQDPAGVVSATNSENLSTPANGISAPGEGQDEPAVDGPAAADANNPKDAPAADVVGDQAPQEPQVAPEGTEPEAEVCVKPADGADADAAEKATPAATADSADKATAAKTMTAASTPMAATASKTYTVRFYDAYGNVVKTQKVKAGKNATAPKLTAMANRTFQRWSTSFKKVTSNLFVYPIFKDKKSNYFFVIDSTDEASSSANRAVQTKIYKAGTMVYLNEPSTNSSTKRKLIVGYSTLPNGMGDVYGMGDSFKMPSRDFIMYPIYAKTGKVKRLTLKRGHNGSTSVAYAVSGTAYRLNGGAYSDDGYTLVGFSTKANGKGKVYALGEKFTMPSKNATLYGVWKKNVARLRLMGNFKQATNVTNYVPVGYKLALSSTTYYFDSAGTREGYYLKGFNTKANGKGTSYMLATGGAVNGQRESTYVTVPKGGLTLYAQWGKQKKLTLKANCKGGENRTLWLTAGNITSVGSYNYRDDYTLTGYSTKKNGAGAFYPIGAFFTAKKAMTLYAQWKKSDAKVTYDANGGTYYGATATSTRDAIKGYGADVNSTPSRDNFVLVEWNTKKDGSGASYLNYTTMTAAKNTTLYAIWKKASILTFDYNYSGSPDPVTRTVKPNSYTYANIYASSSTSYGIPSRADESFMGWATSKSGPVKYAAGAEIKVPAKGLKLYAKWKKKSNTVTFDANGGTIYDYETGSYVKSTKVKVAKGAKLSFSSYPSRENYYLLGWNTKKNGKGASYVSSDFSSSSALNSFTVSKSMTFYAQWGKRPKVTYVANNGTKAKEVDSYAGQLSTDKGFSKKNKALASWNTKANGKGAAFSVGEYVESLPAAGLTIYAQWKNPTATITFSGNGKAANQTQKVMKGQYNYIKAPDEPIAKDGKSYFKEWNTKANGKGEGFYNGLKYQSGKSSTYYAIWGTKETVKFNANGGTGSPADQYAGPGDWLYLGNASYDVSREAYELVGWSKSKTATTPEYDAYESAYLYEKDGATTTLYAVWGAYETVSFNVNGGRVKDYSNLVSQSFGQYGSADLWFASDAVTRDGYTLVEWNTKADGSGASYGTDEILPFEGYGTTLALYAIWQPEV